MELARAFQFAVILSWGGLLKAGKPCLARVAAAGQALRGSTEGRGYQDRACDRWTRASSANPGGYAPGTDSVLKGWLRFLTSS
jgi:hypothetical protein